MKGVPSMLGHQSVGTCLALTDAVGLDELALRAHAVEHDVEQQCVAIGLNDRRENNSPHELHEIGRGQVRVQHRRAARARAPSRSPRARSDSGGAERLTR